MSNKNKKQKLLKRSKFRYYRKIIIWVSFFITLLYGIFFWSAHSSMQISKIEVSGNRFVETAEIENIFFEEIRGRHFFLISKSHFLFIPNKKIESRLEKKLEIDFISIKRSKINNIVIEVVEHKPIAFYCSNETDCYFVNDSGLLFVKSPDFYFDDLLEIAGSIEIKEDESILGKKYATPETFKNLLEKIKLLNTEKIEINKISTEDFETYILHTVGGPTLLVEESDIPLEIVANLKAAIAQESINEVQFDNIDYIDLRFEDKVFYKLK